MPSLPAMWPRTVRPPEDSPPITATWDNFLLPLMMVTSTELKPVTVGLYGMMSYFNPEYGAVLQGALLGVLPLIVLFITLQRYWQAGLTSGAVK